MSSDRLSPHFVKAEFACPHCQVAHVDHELVLLLEHIREAAGGRPLVIRSGYRCPTHNYAVGGAPHSQHLLGRAADIGPGIITPAMAKLVGARGVGIRSPWAVHVDVRKGAQAEWFYT